MWIAVGFWDLRLRIQWCGHVFHIDDYRIFFMFCKNEYVKLPLLNQRLGRRIGRKIHAV
jgi:hypothetical protein